MAESINKKALAEALAEKFEITKKAAGEYVDALFDEIKSELVKGNRVEISGFGRFLVKERAARTGYNPQTKEPIAVPASNAPAFRPAKALKDAVKQEA